MFVSWAYYSHFYGKKKKQFQSTNQLITIYYWSLFTNDIPHMGVSENSVPLFTQWFCWSLSLLNGYLFGNIPYFQHPPGSHSAPAPSGSTGTPAHSLQSARSPTGVASCRTDRTSVPSRPLGSWRQELDRFCYECSMRIHELIIYSMITHGILW